MRYSRLFTVFGLVFLAILSRLLPHPPNFTAVNAVAIFSIATLGHLGISFGVVYASMLLSDLLLGVHSQMVSVYLSIALIMITHRFYSHYLLSLLCSSFLFFIVVNFGVWWTDGLYPPTLEGLGWCYLAALPFLTNQILSTCVYGFFLFGSLRAAEKYRIVL